MPPTGARAPQPNGSAIQAIREAQGWKPGKFAKAAEISHTHLYHIETGRKGASVEVLRRIADTLRVPVVAITKGGPRLEDVA